MLYQRKVSKSLLAGMVTLLMMSCLILKENFKNVTSVAAAPLRLVYPQEQEQMITMRRAGLNGDYAKVPVILSVLQSSSHPHPLVMQTALHSLAQLGATEALPAIDNVIQAEGGSDVGAYAKVAKARLLAESRASATKGNSNPVAVATVRITEFYAELGLNAASLNSGVEQYNHRLQESRLGLAPTFEVYAMREVADIIYRGQYQDYATLPSVAQLKFQLDHASALKIRLAPLARTERVRTIIQDLAHERYDGRRANLEKQLVADEGITASHAAADQLQYMDRHRDQFPREGFNALLGVLDLVGDTGQTALVEHFLHDTDGYIASFARGIYPAVQKGKKGQIAPDY